MEEDYLAKIGISVNFNEANLNRFLELMFNEKEI
jgi:hypothetical protein